MTSVGTRASLAMRRAHEAGQMMLDIDEGELRPLTPCDWSDLNPRVPTKLCRRCCRILPVLCFHNARRRKMHNGFIVQTYVPDCIICADGVRISKWMETIWRPKGRNALDSHREREQEQGLHTCYTLDAYIRLTGVTVDRVERVFRNAYTNNDKCHHCETIGNQAEWQTICRLGADGKLDLHDMTLDRIDRRRLLAPDNMQVICRYGNICRADDPEVEATRAAYWRRHNALTAAA